MLVGKQAGMQDAGRDAGRDVGCWMGSRPGCTMLDEMQDGVRDVG